MKPSIAAAAAVALALAGATHAHSNPCGNQGAPPAVFATEVGGPQALDADGGAPFGWNPLYGRLTRGGVSYVSANSIRVEVTTDRCTTIAGVRFGPRVVTATNSGGFWYSLPVAPQPSDPDRHTHSVLVHFPYAKDGAAENLIVVIGRDGGTGTQEAVFPVVRVRTVETHNVRAPMSYSRANLYNMFAQALANMFGPGNSTVVRLDEDTSYRIYDYDAYDVGVSVSSQGVAFQFSFKTDIPNWCDPTVRAHGRFRLEAASEGFTVVWDDPAQASVTWPFPCNALQYFPGLGIAVNAIYEAVEAAHSGGIKDTVEEEILGALPSYGFLFLNGSASAADELWVNLRLPVPSVTIGVPYDAFDMGRNATLFPAGEKIALTASGLGMSDAPADISPPVTVRSGPLGVPRAGTAFFPRPMAVTRAAPLPRPPLAVGRLLARTSSGPLYLPRYWYYAPGCAVVAPLSTTSTFSSVRLGVNDSAEDARRLRDAGAAPGYTLRAHFLEFQPILARDYPACVSYLVGSR
jgi:hypothetical protein